MDFLNSEEYKKIVKEFKLNSFDFSEIFIFECISDGIVVMSFEKDDILYELHFIANDDVNREMILDDILHLKRIKFFEAAIYLKDNAGEYKNEGSVMFSASNKILNN